VRANAARAGFDAILVPLCLDGRNLNQSPEQSRGTRADCRYLTMMENAAVVMPTDGRPPLVVNDRGVGNRWIADARATSRGTWAPAIAEALLDAGLERARIGVSGLRAGTVSHIRSASGVVNHSAFAEVSRRLPNARFEDATDVVGFARYVKGEEEIAGLRQAARIAVAGIEEMIEVARPGLPAAELTARVIGRMLELGSEQYPLALDIGPLEGEQHRWEEPPVGLTLERGQLIINEVDAVWLGLVAQEDQPILLGEIPEAWQPVIEVQGELYRTGLEVMRPGASFAELVQRVSDAAARHGLQSWSMMHSRGYGNDGPMVNTQGARPVIPSDVEVQPNTVWMWKPTAISADGRIRFRWGGCILVTDHGAEPLVPRTPGLVSVP
jgi:Xaa-Pro aminopeptidase